MTPLLDMSTFMTTLEIICIALVRRTDCMCLARGPVVGGSVERTWKTGKFPIFCFVTVLVLGVCFI